MGTYLNPGNSGFQKIRNSRYVDKTGLIGMINQTIDTSQKLTCISRPRRFGKSFAAQMLCAYYDRSCDSAPLFDDLEIARSDMYRNYLNKYDVIYLDMTNILSEAGKREIVPYIKKQVTQELTKAYPALRADPESFTSTLVNAVELTGNRMAAIIGFRRNGFAIMASLFRASGS